MKIEIISMIENQDGGIDIEFDFDQEFKNYIKKKLKIKRLTKKKFEKFVLESLNYKLDSYNKS